MTSGVPALGVTYQLDVSTARDAPTVGTQLRTPKVTAR